MKLPDQFIIFDTEYTAWEGSQQRKWSLPNEHMELVQIGALKVKKNNKKIEIIDYIKITIKPRINNILSDYFIKLTGITNEEVENDGIDFIDGIKKFIDFCDCMNMYSYGDDYEIFEVNMNLYNLSSNFFLWKYKNKSFDIRDFFEKHNIDTNKYSSGGVYKSLDLKVENESIHDPLFDCMSMFITIKKIYYN